MVREGGGEEMGREVGMEGDGDGGGHEMGEGEMGRETLKGGKEIWTELRREGSRWRGDGEGNGWGGKGGRRERKGERG